MSIESSYREILSGIGSQLLSDQPTKQESLDALKSYGCLSASTKGLYNYANSNEVLSIFLKGFWSKIFGAKDTIETEKDWNALIQRLSGSVEKRIYWTFLKQYAVKVLKNLLNDTPEYNHQFIGTGKFQSFRNEKNLLISSNQEDGSLSTFQVDSSRKNSKYLIQKKWSGKYLTPGKFCSSFFAQNNKYFVCNEGQSNVKIMCKDSEKQLCLLENLGTVKQIEIKDNFLFISVRDENYNCSLLRYSLDELNPLKGSISSPLSLSFPTFHVRRFFLLENRLSYIEVSGLTIRLWSLAIEPTGEFIPLNKCTWITSEGLAPGELVEEGENFILCNKELNARLIHLKRLKITNEGIKAEAIAENEMVTTSLKVDELYLRNKKLFIFCFDRTTKFFSLITYDLETKKWGMPSIFPSMSALKINFPSFAFHSSEEALHFFYYCDPQQDGEEQAGYAMSSINYGAGEF